jgi:hypothetical protein
MQVVEAFILRKWSWNLTRTETVGYQEFLPYGEDACKWAEQFDSDWDKAIKNCSRQDWLQQLLKAQA